MPLVARTDSADAEKGDYGKDLVVTGVRDVPDAAAALTANIANVEISPEENKRLLRKIGESIRVFAGLTVLSQASSYSPRSERSRRLQYTPATLLRVLHPIFGQDSAPRTPVLKRANCVYCKLTLLSSDRLFPTRASWESERTTTCH